MRWESVATAIPPVITEIRAVGFDLGETLLHYVETPLNWAPLYVPALRRVAGDCGIAPSPEQFTLAAQILGQYNTRLVPRAREVSADEIMSLILNAWEMEMDKLPAAIGAFFEFFRQRIQPDSEAIQILKSLRGQNCPVGILTDVPYGMPRAFVERDIADAGLAGWYDVLLTSVDTWVRKPEVLGYQMLAARLGVALREMLYVGNEPKDVIGARRAGALAALLDRANPGDHGQHFTLTSLREIDAIRCGRRAGSRLPVEQMRAVRVEPQ